MTDAKRNTFGVGTLFTTPSSIYVRFDPFIIDEPKNGPMIMGIIT